MEPPVSGVPAPAPRHAPAGDPATARVGYGLLVIVAACVAWGLALGTEAMRFFIVGQVFGWGGAVVYFHFGTSTGSKRNADALRDQLDRLTVGPGAGPSGQDGDEIHVAVEPAAEDRTREERTRSPAPDAEPVRETKRVARSRRG